MSLTHEHEADQADEALQFPCSPAQIRFWALQRMTGDHGALNIALRWQIDGPVPDRLIEQALRRVVARHEILRTGFVETADEPVQVVWPSVVFGVGSVELGALGPAARAEAAERLAREEGRRPFDLAAPPLLRARLLRLGPDQRMLLVTLHHLVADGWSAGVIARELGEICDALTGGREPVLPALPIQYGDYCLWYRERLERDEFAPEIQYWTRQLADLTHLELTSDHPAVPSPGANDCATSDIESLLLARPLSDALVAIGQAQGNTLFVTALAGLAVLLHRYTGATDIAVGTQVIGREEVDLEALVGVFINTIVLRADLSGDPTVADLLQQLQDTVQAGLAHQNVPLEQLIQLLRPSRTPDANPFFSVNFIFQRAFVIDQAHDGFTLTDLPSLSPGRLYDLNFFMVERPDGWRMSCEYDRTLFSPAFVATQLRCWHAILDAMTAGLHGPVSGLTLLDQPTCRWLLQAERGAGFRHPADRTLSRQFEDQAARTPRGVAVQHGRRSLTYAALDRSANGLARYLRRQGVLPGMLVGLLLPHDPDLVVTLLAVLKAGGVAVLLDPDEPAPALERRVAEIRLPWLLTHSTLRSSLPGRIERVFVLDEAVVPIRRELASPLEIPLTGADPACVVFTPRPGASGRAVRLTHGALAAMLLGLAERVGPAPDETLVSIDAADDALGVARLLLPLLVGARLVLAEPGDAADGRALRGLLARVGPALLPAHPRRLQSLLQAGWTGSPRLTLLSDSIMTARLKDSLIATGSPLWMLYGAPEATLCSSVVRILAGTGPVRLKPLPAVSLHVLDRSGRRLPPGAVGELSIGGQGVADGYLGRHAAMRTGFVDGPCADAGSTPGEDTACPLFQTGDLASWRPDGSVELLGPITRHVMRDGYPIDLASIEDGLLRHPDVAEAKVVLSQDGSTNRSSLTAYVVPTAGGLRDAALVEALRQLQAGWPRHRRCGVILALPALPTAASGTPRDGDAKAPDEDEAPLAAMRQRLLLIWSELLGRGDIGIDDDFFDLGGHSLIATRLVARIQKEFDRTIDFATLFRASTVAALSHALLRTDPPRHDGQARAVIAHREPDREQARDGGRRSAIFAIGHTWIYDDLARQIGRDRGFVALPVDRAGGPETEAGAPASPQNLRQIAAEQIAAIREIQPSGPYVLIGLCSAGVLTYEIAQQLQEQGEAVPLLVLVDTWAPGYLRRMPPARARLADLSYRWRSLLTDYRAESAGRPRDAARFVAIHLREFVSKRLRRLTAGIRRPTAEPHRLPAVHSGHWADEDLPPYDERVDPDDTSRASVRRPPFHGRLLVFHRESMPQGRFLDERLGWSDLAVGPIEVFSLPGDHFSMFRGSGAVSMGERITERLQADGL